MKKEQKTVMLSLLFVGILLILIGLFYPIPSRTFTFSNIEKYVGGDAYNAIIESSIRSGEISGAIISKTVYICSGLIIVAISSLLAKSND